MKKGQKKNSKNYSNTNRLGQTMLKRAAAQFIPLLPYLFLLLLPTQLGRHFFPDSSYIFGVKVDYLAYILYFTDILALILFISQRRILKRSLTKHKKILFVLGILFFINAVSSPRPFIAIYKIVKFIEAWFIYLVFKNIDLKTELFLTISAISGLIVLSLATMQFVYKSSIQGIFYLLGERYLHILMPSVAKAVFFGNEILRPYSTFSHPNSMAGFYVLMYFFFLMNPLFKNLKGSSYIMKNAGLTIFTLIIFLSFSKIVILTYVLFNFAIMLSTDKSRCTICKVIYMVALSIIAVVFTSSVGDPLSLAKRISGYSAGVQIFFSHPFFGTGLGQHIIFMADIPTKYSYFLLQPIHNIFLLFITEAGLILVGGIAYLIARYLKTRYTPAYITIVAIVAITGSFDHYWLTLQQNFLLIPVVFGMLSKNNA